MSRRPPKSNTSRRATTCFWALNGQSKAPRRRGASYKDEHERATSRSGISERVQEQGRAHASEDMEKHLDRGARWRGRRRTTGRCHDGLPPNFDETNKYPVVVSAHPIGSCKEQTSGNIYGKAVAEAGFVVVAFDASFQGASGGEPRFIENPEFRVSDFRFVVDYIQTLAYVDVERIGVLGVCGGGGYAINAAMTDYRFKCCVGITPVSFGRLAREVFGKFDPAQSLEQIARQRTVEAQGGERLVVNLLPPSTEEAQKISTDVDIIEAVDYYKTDRGQKPNGCTSALFSFNSAALAWDAFNRAETLMTRPLMVVVGDKPGGFGSYHNSLEIHSRAGSREKHIVVLPGISHYMLYDKPEAVKPALDQVLPFLTKHLGKSK